MWGKVIISDFFKPGNVQSVFHEHRQEELPVVELRIFAWRSAFDSLRLASSKRQQL